MFASCQHARAAGAAMSRLSVRLGFTGHPSTCRSCEARLMMRSQRTAQRSRVFGSPRPWQRERAVWSYGTLAIERPPVFIGEVHGRTAAASCGKKCPRAASRAFRPGEER